MSRKRSLIAAASILGLGLAGAALHDAVRVVEVGVAYKAKAVCSAVFVSGR
jgi:hypothetical protein